MVDIMVGFIPPVQNNQSNGEKQRRGPAKKKELEKRKNKTDRRQSVRAGVVVTLSDRFDKRQTPDRRKNPC